MKDRNIILHTQTLSNYKYYPKIIVVLSYKPIFFELWKIFEKAQKQG